ncbi:MAG: hypothetical protein M1832_006090 [Thelocarpon impressellum]|nr:MAG: hypothetical protein M1832_006090 [Thelocarpon impressellum]
MSLDEELWEEASVARDVAAGLFPFMENVPESSTEISGVMSELFGINAALGDLRKYLLAPQLQRNIPFIMADVALGLPPLSKALEGMMYLFGRLRITPGQGPAAYQRVWREICIVFDADAAPLPASFEPYRLFFLEVITVLRRLPPGPDDIRLLRREVARLAALQDGPIEAALQRMVLAPTGIPAYQPPPLHPPPGGMWVPVPQQWQAHPRPPQPPQPPQPPCFAEAPMPPAAAPAAAAAAAAAPAGAAVTTQRHWALDLFDGRFPITPFVKSGLRSRCLGPHVEGAQQDLSMRYNKLVDMSVMPEPARLNWLREFDDGQVTTVFYHNPADLQTRLLILAAGDGFGQPSKQICASLASLRIHRERCCIQLYETDHATRTKRLWASLRFATYERLILFHCLFTVLKARVPAGPTTRPSDFVVEREIKGQSFEIKDDGFIHGLRIHKDRHSAGVRLEASVHRGELKGTPVWTAFVTDLVGLPWFAKRAKSKVRLTEIRPYVFCSEYRPPTGERGELELRFESSEGESSMPRPTTRAESLNVPSRQMRRGS